LRPEIDARWPKVLRRVGGYNLDIFHNQNERPYTNDGAGQPRPPADRQRRHAGAHEIPDASPERAAARQGAGRGELPDLLQGHGRPSTSCAGRRWHLSAVELVDRTMIELALQNPAFAARCAPALSPKINQGKPDAILLVEFSGDPRPTSRQKSGNWSN
jgi:hypothetical protein